MILSSKAVFFALHYLSYASTTLEEVQSVSDAETASCGFSITTTTTHLVSTISDTLPLKEQVQLFKHAVLVFHDLRAARDIVLCNLLGHIHSAKELLSYCTKPGIENLRWSTKSVADTHMIAPCKYYAMALKWGSKLIPQAGIGFLEGMELVLAKYFGLWLSEVQHMEPRLHSISHSTANTVHHSHESGIKNFWIKRLPNGLFDVDPSVHLREDSAEQVFLKRWLNGPNQKKRAMFYLLNAPRAVLSAPLFEVIELFQGHGLQLRRGIRFNKMVVCKSFVSCQILILRVLVEEQYSTTDLAVELSKILRPSFERQLFNEKLMGLDEFHRNIIIRLLLVKMYWPNEPSLTPADLDLMLKGFGLPAAIFEQTLFADSLMLGNIVSRLASIKFYPYPMTADHVHFLVLFSSSENVFKEFIHNLNDEQLNEAAIDEYLANFLEQAPDPHFVDCVLRLEGRHVSEQLFRMLLAAGIRCKGLFECRQTILAKLREFENIYGQRIHELRACHTTVALNLENCNEDLLKEVQLNTHEGIQAVDGLCTELMFLQDSLELPGLELAGLVDIICS